MTPSDKPIEYLAACEATEGSGPRDNGCSICREEIGTSEASVLHTKCSVCFHKICLDSWVKSSSVSHGNYQASCPMCRGVITLPAPPMDETTLSLLNDVHQLEMQSMANLMFVEMNATSRSLLPDLLGSIRQFRQNLVLVETMLRLQEVRERQQGQAAGSAAQNDRDPYSPRLLQEPRQIFRSQAELQAHVGPETTSANLVGEPIADVPVVTSNDDRWLLLELALDGPRQWRRFRFPGQAQPFYVPGPPLFPDETALREEGNTRLMADPEPSAFRILEDFGDISGI